MPIITTTTEQLATVVSYSNVIEPKAITIIEEQVTSIVTLAIATLKYSIVIVVKAFTAE